MKRPVYGFSRDLPTGSALYHADGSPVDGVTKQYAEGLDPNKADHQVTLRCRSYLSTIIGLKRGCYWLLGPRSDSIELQCIFLHGSRRALIYWINRQWF